MNTRNVPKSIVRLRWNVRTLLPLFTVLSLCCALIVGLASAADAQRGRWARGGQGPMMRGLGFDVLGLTEELELTEQQVTRLKDIRQSAPSKIMPKTQALMEVRIEYRDLMADANADSKALRAAHGRVLEAQAQLKAATFDLRLEVRDVLTPEQRSELKQHVRQRVRERARRPRRLHRERWGQHGSLGDHFQGMGEHFGNFDEGEFGLGPFDPAWSGERPFSIDEEREEIQEGEGM